MRIWQLCLLTTIAMGCASMTKNDHQTSSAQADALAAQLGAVDTAAMALGLASDPQVQKLWSESSDPELYATILADRRRPAQVRFAAALMLKSHNQKGDPAATAEAFAAALQQDMVHAAYPWGWLWNGPDRLGLLGGTFVEAGRPAIPALVGLLDDTTPRDTYLGSEEATEMKMKRYRVKDFAAFYLAKITGDPLPWEQDLAKRDEAIARVRSKVASSGS